MRRAWVLVMVAACSRAPSVQLVDSVDGGRWPSDGGPQDLGAPDLGPADGGDPTEALITAWAAAECSHLLRCRELHWAYYAKTRPGWDVGSSRAAFAGLTRSELEWYRARANEGLVRDPDPRAVACVVALNGPCGVDPHREGEACNFRQDGLVADGAPCFDGFECESGVCLNDSDSLECGTCGARLADGDPCRVVVSKGLPRCAVGSYCGRDRGDGTRVCTRLASRHESCRDILCEVPLVCSTAPEDWTCELPGIEGSACDGPGDDLCPYDRLLECRDGSCRRFELAFPGDPCGPGFTCQESSGCDPNTQRCGELAPIGSPCTYRWDCASGACAAPEPLQPLVCVVPKPDGAPCTSPGECEGGRCRGEPGRCTRPSTWRRCE